MTNVSFPRLFRAWLLFVCILCAAHPLLLCQDRNFRTERIILDDDASDGSINNLILQAPSLGANLTLTFPATSPSANGSILSSATDGRMNWTNTPSLSSLTLSNGLTVTGGSVDLSGATSVSFPAGSIGFGNISSGTSIGSSLLIGTGSTLRGVSGGIIAANEFIGSGSTTTAVDLGTGEVAGILGIATGGTNSTATPIAGGVAYGNGTSYQCTAAGVAGQFLVSDGTNAPVWSNTIPSTGAPFTVIGSPAVGSMLTVNENGTNSPNLIDLQVGGSSVLLVENNGETGFGTSTPTHPVHAVNSQATDERAAVYGVANTTTTNQAVGVWGDANATGGGNTGSVGVLASGNGNSTAGTTNIALQVNDGEFTMGRTTQTGTGYTVVEGAVGGTDYSAQGPSGIVEVAIPGIVVALPVVGQSLFNTTVTVNNRYVSSSSLVLVTIQDAPAGLLALLGSRLVATTSVSGRTAGSFNVTFSIHNLSLLGLNIGAGNVRIGYMVVNPSR